MLTELEYKPCITAVRRSSLGLLELQLAALSSCWAQKNPGEENWGQTHGERRGEEKGVNGG